MDSFTDDSSVLLQSSISGVKASKTRIFPIIYAGLIYFSIFASLLLRFELDNPINTIPALPGLPQRRPYVLQLGIFIACSLGIVTIISVHYALLQQSKTFGINRFWVYISGLFGAISMISLFLWALAPSEKGDAQEIVIRKEERAAVCVFNVFSILHGISTLILTHSCRKREIISQIAPWITVKAIFLAIMVIMLPMDLTGIMMNEPESSVTMRYSTMETYFFFFLNIAYFALYYYDLKYVSLEFNYKPETQEFKLLNGSTF